ncbi:hypothetical protein ANO11243_056470 [Dothideomycetidae sp. 11243]|nr:hypothetical protein ANO11243_056470 [fungal sp. No.11243]
MPSALAQTKTRPSSKSISKAHIPTLKGAGKSDCEVKIIHIDKCEAFVPLELVAAGDNGSDLLSPCELESALLAARAPSPCLLPEPSMSLAMGGSRSSRVQKASRRPQLARRDTPQRSPRPSTPSGLVNTRSYIDSSTIRRLTSGSWAVRKEAHDGGKQDGSRLLKQIRKQIIFSAECRNSRNLSNVSTPEIYGLRQDNHSIVVDMEYIPFQDVKHIMLTQDKATNEWLVETAVSIVDYELSKCTPQRLSSVLSTFTSKANSIKSALGQKVGGLVSFTEMDTAVAQIDKVMGYFSQRGHLSIPMGPCHGDLTFQNMLVDFTARELCVFDFLDSFVETPLQDIAKLLQDCRHLWFLTQVSVTLKERARVVTMLDSFHDKIMNAYYDYEIWEVLPLFEFFCLARILPYMTTEQEKVCILTGMTRICNDLGNTGPDMCDSPYFLPVSPTFSGDEKVTVIVPAMGAEMAQTHPATGQTKLLSLDQTNVPLVVRSVAGLATENVSSIVLAVEKQVILRECGSTEAFERLFDDLDSRKHGLLEFYYSEDQTSDVIETVLAVQAALDIAGAVFIKDADNDFTFSIEAGNYMTLVNLVSGNQSNNNRSSIADATHKSYVGSTYDNVISNLAYGSFVSSRFACGGWGFVDMADFVRAATDVRRSLSLAKSLVPASSPGDVKLQVADIIWKLIVEGTLFFGIEVSDYADWGCPQA